MADKQVGYECKAQPVHQQRVAFPKQTNHCSAVTGRLNANNCLSAPC